MYILYNIGTLINPWPSATMADKTIIVTGFEKTHLRRTVINI